MSSPVVADFGTTPPAVAKPVKGYPRLAARMGRIPETAIIRRFAALNARNLLYLQAELIRLEEQLAQHELADSRSAEGERANFARNWYWLSVSGQDGYGEQWQTFLEIRQKLKDYNDTVLQQHAMAALPEPDKRDLRDLQAWMIGDDQGEAFFDGADHSVWGLPDAPKDHASDLIALRSRHDEDPFSKWVTRSFIHDFHRLFGYRFKQASPEYAGEAGYEEPRLLELASVVVTVIASLLPIAAITILYCVHSMPVRLGIIAAFNLTFSLCLHRFSKAKGSEIFAATATFAAVQVVFVGSSGSNSTPH